MSTARGFPEMGLRRKSMGWAAVSRKRGTALKKERETREEESPSPRAELPACSWSKLRKIIGLENFAWAWPGCSGFSRVIAIICFKTLSSIEERGAGISQRTNPSLNDSD